MTSVLIVGGTAEARALAARLVGDGVAVTTSLAGAVARPRLPPGEVWVGGFGGPSGLAVWLAAHRPDAVVDASHPFAARISASCVTACGQVGVPLLRLERPAWRPVAGDRWVDVGSVSEGAGVAARLGSRLLVTTGRRDLAAFAPLSGVQVVARCVDPPEPLPGHVTVLLDRGPYTVEGERDLLRRHGIAVLVSKNSGGSSVSAKLVAARELGLRVVMVRRPAPAGAATVPDVEAAHAWARDRVAVPT